MALEIKMPPLSQTTDSVMLIEWLVKEGDTIKKGDPICKVETDKVTMEVESFASGTILKIIGQAGKDITVDSVIAMIGKPGEIISDDQAWATRAVSTPELRVDTSTPGLSSSTKPQRTVSEIKATPLVKRLAQKRGIDLEKVKGSGAKGLIVRADLEAYLAVSETVPEGKLPSHVDTLWREEALSNNQQSVARNLTRSKSEIPHYYIKISVFVDQMLGWREQHTAREGKKAAIYSIYVFAVSRALKAFPGINGFCRDNKHLIYNQINIGIAMASGRELYVPAVKQADKKSIQEIDAEVRLLTEKAQNGKFEPNDITGGTFTISNLGVFPIEEFAAIISPGQAGIIAMGRNEKRLFIDDENRMQIRRAASLTGSFDHRIVNGAEGAAFLEKVKEILEKEF